MIVLAGCSYGTRSHVGAARVRELAAAV
jgi:hypothetical protein